jgi:hypothetical protein
MEILGVEAGEVLVYCRLAAACRRPPKEAIGFLL